MCTHVLEVCLLDGLKFLIDLRMTNERSKLCTNTHKQNTIIFSDIGRSSLRNKSM